jgi:hypothetical protein
MWDVHTHTVTHLAKVPFAQHGRLVVELEMLVVDHVAPRLLSRVVVLEYFDLCRRVHVSDVVARAHTHTHTPTHAHTVSFCLASSSGILPW